MFRNCALKSLVLVLSIWQVCSDDRPPLYKYRYQTEDMMKTSETALPLRGYHVVEGGYFPAESGLIGAALPIAGGGIGLGGGQFIGPIGYGGLGAGGIGLGGGGIGLGGIGYAKPFIGGGGIGGGIGAAGLGGGYIPPIVHGFGGEEIEKSQFSGAKKNLHDDKYEKAHGKRGEELNHGQAGYTQGAQAVKDIKGEEGYYKNAEGGKRLSEEGKHYQGGEHFNKEGKDGAEKSLKKGHKKGHVIKGYKSSSHKDESGKTEEFYDEEHDEGSENEFKGQSGAFGQKGQSAYKGEHEDGKFNEEEKKKTGHIANEYAVKKENSDEGKYGENKYANQGSVYGVNNGIDEQSLLGHQENSKFIKHKPFYHHY